MLCSYNVPFLYFFIISSYSQCGKNEYHRPIHLCKLFYVSVSGQYFPFKNLIADLNLYIGLACACCIYFVNLCNVILPFIIPPYANKVNCAILLVKTKEKG